MGEGKTNMFGKTYNTIGSTDSNFIIKTKGDLKVQWGSKYIDIIKNGKINTNNKILKTISSTEDIKLDGIYLILPSLLWVMIEGTKILISGDSDTSVSFLLEQKEITAEQKNRALTNIGFYYNSLKEALDAGLLSGLIYVQEDTKLYIIKDGVATEYVPSTALKESNADKTVNTPIMQLNSTIPIGTIVMWNGSNIPKGWALCDGANGTPNLIGSFIKGSDTTSLEPTVPDGINPQTNEFTLETKHLPKHRHPHTHTLDNLSGTAESENIEVVSDANYFQSSSSGSASTGVTGASTVSIINNPNYKAVKSSGSHSHNIVINNGTVLENTEEQDNWIYDETIPFKIEPKHFKVMFIMKIAEDNN